MTEMLRFIKLTADFTPPGSDETIPAGATGTPWYMPPPEGSPSCFTPGIRIGLSFYDIMFKNSDGIEKIGTVMGQSEDGGGLPGEWCHFIEVHWDGDDEPSRVHPHNILRVPNTYRFQWDPYKPENDPFTGHPRWSKLCDVADVAAGAEYAELNKTFGQTGWYS